MKKNEHERNYDAKKRLENIKSRAYRKQDEKGLPPLVKGWAYRDNNGDVFILETRIINGFSVDFDVEVDPLTLSQINYNLEEEMSDETFKNTPELDKTYKEIVDKIYAEVFHNKLINIHNDDIGWTSKIIETVGKIEALDSLRRSMLLGEELNSATAQRTMNEIYRQKDWIVQYYNWMKHSIKETTKKNISNKE